MGVFALVIKRPPVPYVPPEGDAVDFTFSGSYTPPVGDDVDFIF